MQGRQEKLQFLSTTIRQNRFLLAAAAAAPHPPRSGSGDSSFEGSNLELGSDAEAGAGDAVADTAAGIDADADSTPAPYDDSGSSSDDAAAEEEDEEVGSLLGQTRGAFSHGLRQAATYGDVAALLAELAQGPARGGRHACVRRALRAPALSSALSRLHWSASVGGERDAGDANSTAKVKNTTVAGSTWHYSTSSMPTSCRRFPPAAGPATHARCPILIYHVDPTAVLCCAGPADQPARCLVAALASDHRRTVRLGRRSSAGGSGLPGECVPHRQIHWEACVLTPAQACAHTGAHNGMLPPCLCEYKIWRGIKLTERVRVVLTGFDNTYV